ncbi:bifunctional precorrin-2 dehydrogenase/sirohydrochlorin ferrochelatase [Geovibrio thiophilus]|uniref:precorrin-2 dehydrogenase n=1 Tax=Geovibrio thiophilus TaxID=139438 RepID=A0A3R5UYA3_9BACT|nr:bifunctional precorrin-2 dehydrogenase/sirohydrochlorin ferrochelatase [Geovibrio thiophilus]QAR33446.1 bifunctional precorrin-2 dehydrogenase/sirohydrochlorin ferrochelatase [Geovibrio thiophilus]
MKLSYFPLSVNIRGKRLVFIGGGKVAERKIASLIRMEPKIRVIAPSATEGIMNNEGIETILRVASAEDMRGADFLFICTDDKEVNRELAIEAKIKNIPVNVADDPDMSDFHMPAVYADMDTGTVVSVSTQGQEPSFSKKLRDKIAVFLEKGE